MAIYPIQLENFKRFWLPYQVLTKKGGTFYSLAVEEQSCIYELGVLFACVLKIRALLFGVYTRASDDKKLPDDVFLRFQRQFQKQ